MNLRPSGYEPDELPDCSIPRQELLMDMCRLSYWCRGPESNRYDLNDRRILSPVRLPVPPPRQMALRVGLEPTTYRLTAGCSTIELPKIICLFINSFISEDKSSARQFPTLPGRYQPSTIGVKRLNFCVRDGNRCVTLAIVTGRTRLHTQSLWSSLRPISIS